jgi:UDP-glucose 4-epimerase
MKILVTGGAGFIGSNIADRYISDGHEVVILDDLSSGKEKNVNQRAKFYKISVCDESIEDIFARERFDAVNHHAAQMDVRKSVADPKFDATVNVLGIINLLENCKKFGAGKFIFASSGGVMYGEVAGAPAKEDSRIEPMSPYGVSKRSSEIYLQCYHLLYGMEYSALRYGNVYGPRQDPHGEAGVVAIFTQKMLKGEDVTIYGTGEQIRDYVFIDDVVRANALALTSRNSAILNVGTGIGTSVNTLHKQLAKIIGNRKEPAYGERRKGEVERSILDPCKAKEALGWEPQVEIENGLKRTVEYFRA